MKKVYIYCALTALILCLFSIKIHDMTKKEDTKVKVGFLFPSDEITPYTANFIDAEKELVAEYGDEVECVLKYNVSEADAEKYVSELLQENCDYIIAASYGYETAVKEIAAKHTDVQFCVPAGDNANEEPVLSNYHTCFGTIYQGRYACGVVAGEKLKELIDEGTITADQAKVGYVAAFSNAEVISGYTAFYLGVQSVVPQATMLVKYTDTWSNYHKEMKATEELIDEGCIVISQHTNTIGPAVACEAAAMEEKNVYHVGYHQSMREVAPTSSLVSCGVNYTNYFIQSVEALLDGDKIENHVKGTVIGQDAMGGYKEGWVQILDLNTAILPDGIEDVVAQTMEGLENGSIQVFYGDFTGVNPEDASDTVDLHTAYKENAQSSAPSFHYVLEDVITIL